MITPELAEVITAAIDDRLIDVHNNLPGRIQSYDKTKQTATVELQLNRLLENDEGGVVSEVLPVLQNVRVVFPRVQNYYLYFPITEGASGDVIFSDASIGQWLATGTVSDPEDIGRHTLSGAKFYPGLYPDDEVLVDVIEDGMQLGQTGKNKITLKDDGSIILNTSELSMSLNADKSFVVDNGSGDMTLQEDGSIILNTSDLSMSLNADKSFVVDNGSGDMTLSDSGQFSINGGNLTVD